jgi:hypothetical protein
VQRAETIAVKSAEMRADEDAYVVSAEFDLAFTPTLEEAIQKGVPLYFVFEFELMRPRRRVTTKCCRSPLNTAFRFTRSRGNTASRAASSARISTR